MICKNCSREFNGKFCPECGTPAEQEPVAVAEPITEQQPVAEPIVEHVSELIAVAEPAAEAVVAEPIAEKVPVSEPAEQGAQAAPPVFPSYYEPISEAAPKKKGKKAIIIISIILAVLIAAFCVVSFTDIVFTKQAQFVKILSSMGTPCDIGLDPIDSEYTETKLSIKVNDDHEMLRDEFSRSEMSTVEQAIDLINSISLSLKSHEGDGETDIIVTAYEGDIKLADIYGLVTKNEFFGKLGFSDVTFKAPMPTDLTNSKARAEQFRQFVADRMTELFKDNEFEKGDYEGAFKLGMDAKTITVTLEGSDAVDLWNDIVEEYSGLYGLDKSLFGDYDFAKLGIDKISVSALYTGAFSYARKSLGVSVVLEGGEKGNKVELIFFSNKENKAIYGLSAKNLQIAFVDEFKIKNGEQKGVITLEVDGKNINEEEDDFYFGIEYAKGQDYLDVDFYYNDGWNTVSVVGAMKKNYLKLDAAFDVDGEEFEYSMLTTRDDSGLSASFKIGIYDEDLVELNITQSACDAFDVEVDKSNAIDVSDDEALENAGELGEKFAEDLLAWMDENEDKDSVVFELLGEAIAKMNLTVLEQYMLDEFDIEFTHTDFSMENRGSFVWKYGGYIDVQEFGYEDDVIKEMVETFYMDVSIYDYEDRLEYLQIIKDTYAHTYDMDDVSIECRLYGDYVVCSIYLSNMDDPQRLQAFREAGLVGGDASMSVLAYRKSVDAMVDLGFVEVE